MHTNPKYKLIFSIFNFKIVIILLHYLYTYIYILNLYKIYNKLMQYNCNFFLIISHNVTATNSSKPHTQFFLYKTSLKLSPAAVIL